MGASFPFIFRFWIDPALTSSPNINTIMDVVGLLVYFRIVLWTLWPMLGGAEGGVSVGPKRRRGPPPVPISELVEALLKKDPAEREDRTSLVES